MIKRNILILGLLGFLVSLAYGASVSKYDKSVTLSIVGTDSLTLDTTDLFSCMKVSGMHGIIIFNASSYNEGVWGDDDSAKITLISKMGPLTYTLAVLEDTSVPCTMRVNVDDDSLFLERMLLVTNWYDTIGVTAGSTATATVEFDLKLWLF